MDEPKFLADSMLGKLARWLVLLGYDAESAGADGRPDSALQAQAQGRVFLTRDTRIRPVAGLRMLVIRGEKLEDQLRFVLGELGLKPDRKRLFTRCTNCNTALAAISREEALPLVPPLVRALKTEFWRCPSCARVYWNGTHTERTVAKLDAWGL